MTRYTFRISFAHGALCLLCILSLAACSSHKEDDFVQLNAADEISRLSKENRELTLQNEQLKANSVNEAKLSGKIDFYFAHKDYEKAHSYIEVFLDLFPNSLKYGLYDSYNKEIANIKKETLEKQREQSEKEATSATGIWAVASFADDLSSKGSSAGSSLCIFNQGLITGTYSDKTVIDESLKVNFLIKNKNSVNLLLYKGQNEECVKASTKKPVRYKVTMTDGSGKKHSLSARSTSDKIVFDRTQSATIHNAFMNGGSISFVLSSQSNGEAVVYEFSIPNVQNYNNAYRMLD